MPPPQGPKSITELTDEMIEAMGYLGRDHNIRMQMGAAAKRYVNEHFNWDKKGNDMQEIYK